MKYYNIKYSIPGYDEPDYVYITSRACLGEHLEYNIEVIKSYGGKILEIIKSSE